MTPDEQLILDLTRENTGLRMELVELKELKDTVARFRELGEVYRAPDDWDHAGMGGPPTLEQCEKIDLGTY